jgi:hypothetical protein
MSQRSGGWGQRRRQRRRRGGPSRRWAGGGRPPHHPAGPRRAHGQADREGDAEERPAVGDFDHKIGNFDQMTGFFKGLGQTGFGRFSLPVQSIFGFYQLGIYV